MNVSSVEWEAPAPSGVAIGVFDGVHRGHAAVIGGVVQRGRAAGLSVGVLTFDPHPLEVLAPNRAPLLLTTIERRVELLEELGVDWVGILDLRQIHTMSPVEFVDEIVLGRASAREVSVGADFRFGHQREGSVATLEELGRERTFEVKVVDLVQDDDGVISSARIRRMIDDGEVAAAAQLLGREHSLAGQVTRGEARGRDLGYPTANIRLPDGMAVPADGIYAVRVRGAVTADGVASLGVRPTFGTEGERLLEVHIFDYAGDLYGQELEIAFVQRLRGEEKFDSVDALVAQMEKDAADARRTLEP